MKTIVSTLALVLGVAASAAAQPCYLQGQSNAVELARYVGDACLVNATGGASIAQWDGATPIANRAALEASLPFTVHVWWQGEADEAMPAAEYYNRLVAVLLRVGKPTMIVQIAPTPGNAHIRAVHAALAAHPLVALIPTDDLETISGGPHFWPWSYQAVVSRLVDCFNAACWAGQ